MTEYNRDVRIRQVAPKPEATRGLAAGDRLFHFFAESSEGDSEYFLAIHQVTGGNIRTACQCMSAIFNLVRPQSEPCCKHAAEALKALKSQL